MKILRRAALTAVVAASLAVTGYSGVSAQAANTYSTGFQIQNLSDTAANVSISFYPEGTGTASAQVTATVPAKGSTTYATLPTAVTAGFSGGAVISADQKVAAIVNIIVNNNFFYGAAYSGFSAGAKTISAPLIFKAAGGFSTFYSVQNTSTTAANVTVTYSNGATETGTIQPGSSKRFDQSALAGLPAGFVGSAIITSDQDVAAAVVQQGPTTVLSYNGFTALDDTAPVFPLINANNAGFITGISLLNTGTAATDVTVTYTPSSPSTGASCTETKTIAPKTAGIFAVDAFRVATTGSTCAAGQLFVGSAKVTANTGNQPLQGVVNQLNSTTNKGEAYNGVSVASGTNTIVYPLIQDNVAGYFTGFSIVNVGTVATPVSCTFSNSTVTQQVASLAPGATYTDNQSGKLGAGYNGSAVCSASASGAKIVGILNQVNVQRTTNSFFVTNGINN